MGKQAAGEIPGLEIQFQGSWISGYWGFLSLHQTCLTRLPSPPAAAAAAKSLLSCPTLSDLMDYSPPGSSIHGIFQARVLEWVATAFSALPSYISPIPRVSRLSGLSHLRCPSFPSHTTGCSATYSSPGLLLIALISPIFHLHVSRNSLIYVPSFMIFDHLSWISYFYYLFY